MNLELFPCTGGLAEGLRRAGIRMDVAVDSSLDACDSYEENLGHRPVHMDVHDLLRMVQAGWRAPVDFLCADPPCTPWSRAGHRKGLEDDRDMIAVTVELVRLLRPTRYLIANVPGLDDGPNWHIVQTTIGSLSKVGYCVVDFARLDAANYGVPQRRVRPFWFGHLEGPCLQWPAPTHGDPASQTNLSLGGMALQPWVTCRQALGHLPPDELGSPVRLRWRACNTSQHGSVPEKPARTVGTSNLSDGNVLLDGPNHRPSKFDAPARTLTRNTHGDGALLLNAKHLSNDLDTPSRTVVRRGENVGSRLLAVPGDGSLLAHDKHPINSPDEPSLVVSAKGDRGAQGAAVMEWPWDAPSTTITKRDEQPPHGRQHSDGTSARSHPNAVKLSEKAGAILQGFPDGWRFLAKSKMGRWSFIGQAMPPPLGEAVGRAIVQQIQASARKAGAA